MTCPKQLVAALLLVLAPALAAAPAGAATDAKADKAAADAVGKFLQRALRGKRVFPHVRAQLKRLAKVDEAVLATVLPHQRFFALRFRMYPVAYALPAPLRSANLFAVGAMGKGRVTHMTSAKDLQAFCHEHLRATDAKAARAAAHAYSVLRVTLAQDGFFRFAIQPARFKVRATRRPITVGARIDVVPGGGNSGAIEVDIAFQGAKGVFAVADERVRLRVGMRPICQSLKLTLRDQAVREQAERDLLLMGVNALPYLRAQAGTRKGELRRRILALIRRIEAGEGGENLPGGQPPAN